MSLEHRFVDGDDDAPVLVLLHGTGGGPDDLLGVASELAPSAAVLAPVGPVSEGGMTRWFRRHAEGIFDHEDVLRRTHQLADFLVAARREYPIADRRFVAVGFSNGANIATAVAMFRPDALQEVAAFAGMLPHPEPPEHDLAGTRVFLANGERDPMAPIDSADRLVGLLRDRSAEVRTHRHPGGHELTMDALREARDWFAG
ncbi:alpha/beta hydrolase [Haloechinothrix sp. LS1_15]|nr:alpha/beta hydrolase [Haloechinothrix sp. LS1_15]